MKKMGFIFLFLSLTGLVHSQARSVLQQNAPEKTPFAKPFVANIILSHPQGKTIELVPESTAKDFEITKIKWKDISPETTQASILMMPFAIDKSTFTVAFSLVGTPDMQAKVEIPIEIAEVKLFKDNKLKEIRPPNHPFNWVSWLCVILGLLALAGFIYAWLRYIQRENPTLHTPVDNRPAHVIALSQIDALVNSGLWEKQEYKLFYITLTDILRTYLQKAFSIDVSADTSAELLRHLKTVPQVSAYVQSLRVFLSSGDLVKFAKAIPSEKTRNTDITILREFIVQTSPKTQPDIPHTLEVKL